MEKYQEQPSDTDVTFIEPVKSIKLPDGTTNTKKLEHLQALAITAFSSEHDEIFNVANLAQFIFDAPNLERENYSKLLFDVLTPTEIDALIQHLIKLEYEKSSDPNTFMRGKSITIFLMAERAKGKEGEQFYKENIKPFLMEFTGAIKKDYKSIDSDKRQGYMLSEKLMQSFKRILLSHLDKLCQSRKPPFAIMYLRAINSLYQDNHLRHQYLAGYFFLRFCGSFVVDYQVKVVKQEKDKTLSDNYYRWIVMAWTQSIQQVVNNLDKSIVVEGNKANGLENHLKVVLEIVGCRKEADVDLKVILRNIDEQYRPEVQNKSLEGILKKMLVDLLVTTIDCQYKEKLKGFLDNLPIPSKEKSKHIRKKIQTSSAFKAAQAGGKKAIDWLTINNHNNKLDETRLITAAKDGNLNLVEDLLRRGAGTLLRDKEGHSALWHALKIKNSEVILALLLNSNEIDVEIKTWLSNPDTNNRRFLKQLVSDADIDSKRKDILLEYYVYVARDTTQQHLESGFREWIAGRTPKSEKTAEKQEEWANISLEDNDAEDQTLCYLIECNPKKIAYIITSYIDTLDNTASYDILQKIQKIINSYLKPLNDNKNEMNGIHTLLLGLTDCMKQINDSDDLDADITNILKQHPEQLIRIFNIFGVMRVNLMNNIINVLEGDKEELKKKLKELIQTHTSADIKMRFLDAAIKSAGALQHPDQKSDKTTSTYAQLSKNPDLHSILKKEKARLVIGECFRSIDELGPLDSFELTKKFETALKADVEAAKERFLQCLNNTFRHTKIGKTRIASISLMIEIANSYSGEKGTTIKFWDDIVEILSTCDKTIQKPLVPLIIKQCFKLHIDYDELMGKLELVFDIAFGVDLEVAKKEFLVCLGSALQETIKYDKTENDNKKIKKIRLMIKTIIAHIQEKGVASSVSEFSKKIGGLIRKCNNEKPPNLLYLMLSSALFTEESAQQKAKGVTNVTSQ